MALNIDPGKIAAEVGQTWRQSPFIVGTQIVILLMLGFFAWDRKVTRESVVEFVNGVMAAQDARSETLAARQSQANSEMILRLNHLTDTLTATIIDCYRSHNDEAAPPPLPQSLQSRPGDGGRR